MSLYTTMLDFFREIRINSLQFLARRVLAKYKPTIVALTGSVGKTSAKDAIFEALESSLLVRKNIKSYNGELGTPLTILGCEVEKNSLSEWLHTYITGLSLVLLPHPYPKYLVLEVGLGRPNELRKISSWLSPDVVVITALSKVPVHVAYFPTVESLIEEKSTLAKAVKPSGTLILNADDDQVVEFKNVTTAKKVFYGEGPLATAKASNYKIRYAEDEKPLGVEFSAMIAGRSFPIFLKDSLGHQHIYPVLSALSVAEALNVPLEKAAEALQKHTATSGRMRIIEGMNGSTIIDDSYNSSPVALEEALKTLADIKAKGKKIAVLGDMRELGDFAPEAHKKAGLLAAKTADLLIGVGPLSEILLDSAIASGFPKEKTKHFLDSVEAGNYLKPLVAPNDVILIKGSQNTIRLERTVKILMKHPELARELLIRQGEFWEKR